MDSTNSQQTMVNSTLQTVSTNVLKYAPIATAAAQAIEQTSLNGEEKRKAVVSVILAGATAAEKSQDVNVSTIGALVDFAVALLNMAGVFTHSK